MFEKTHAYLMKEAIKLLKFDELKCYKKQLIDGVMSPDDYYRVVGHFYNPKTGKGLLFCGNAKDRGIKAYENAVKCYKKGNKEKAYFLLGRSVHFLMDMTVPAHTIPIIHPFSTDDLEIYLLSNPVKPANVKPVDKKVESYFIDAAKESRKMKVMPNGVIIALRFKYFGKKQKLNAKELKSQAKIVIPRAVSYSAGLLDKFYKSIC